MRWITRFGALAVAAFVAATLVVAAVSLSRPDPGRSTGTPPPHSDSDVAFTGYTLIKTGGIAGVYYRTTVAKDGTTLIVDDRPVAGQLPQRTVDRLAKLLADPRLGDRGKAPARRCADAFTYTLVAADTKVTAGGCGGDAPVLDEIIALTSRRELRPLPADAKNFHGLTATYRRLQEPLRARVRIGDDGGTTVSRSDRPTRHGHVGARTLDALRLLYADGLAAPTPRASRACVPEQVPTYTITPDGRPTVTVSPCGRLDDARWVARLRIIDNLIGV